MQISSNIRQGTAHKKNGVRVIQMICGEVVCVRDTGEVVEGHVCLQTLPETVESVRTKFLSQFAEGHPSCKSRAASSTTKNV